VSPPSPWQNESVAPLQAAAALVPIVDFGHGPIFLDELHGTAFFVSDAGFFLTAAHVIAQFPSLAPPLQLVILGGYGEHLMPVAFVMRHPKADVALGLAVINRDHPTKVSAMTLSSRRLAPGEDVAILGYPRTSIERAVSEHGEVGQRFTFTPDYFEGQILEHHPNGVGLVRGAAYSTNIGPPPPLKDFAGISGGPLVASDTVHVHGITNSASESYSLCSDIETILDWEVFNHDSVGNLTVRAFGDRYPGVIHVAS
jgi:Trypsin-like peptidase domain